MNMSSSDKYLHIEGIELNDIKYKLLGIQNFS
jgi:hypothetical protein